MNEDNKVVIIYNTYRERDTYGIEQYNWSVADVLAYNPQLVDAETHRKNYERQNPPSRGYYSAVITNVRKL
jgi:hypothetical protein